MAALFNMIFNFQSERDISAFSHNRTILSFSVAKFCSFRFSRSKKKCEIEYVGLLLFIQHFTKKETVAHCNVMSKNFRVAILLRIKSLPFGQFLAKH